MIKIKQAVIVEGKYDKIKLSSLIDGVIIPTNGFGIFKDKEMMSVIRRLASTCGIVIMTDSDSAGFLIRNHILGSVKDGKIYNAYIPDILGKEKRKAAPSCEGKLGVEGMSGEIVLEALRKAGVTDSGETEEMARRITKTDLYLNGLSGSPDCQKRRKALLEKLDLPERLTTNAMLDVLNILLSFEEYEKLVSEID